MKFTDCFNPREAFLCVWNPCHLERHHGGMSHPNSDCIDPGGSIRDRKKVLNLPTCFPIVVLPIQIHTRIRARFPGESNACLPVLTIPGAMNPRNDASGIGETENFEEQQCLEIDVFVECLQCRNAFLGDSDV